MQRIRSAMRRNDDGVALIMAVMTGTFAVALTLVVVSTAIVSSQNSGYDRQRSVAVSAAEAGVDASYASVQSAAAATLPCTVSVTSKGSDVTSVTSSLRYFDATGAVIACAGGYVPVASAANVTKAEIVSTATTTSVAGVTKSKRTMEALANIKPVLTATLGDALFSNSTISFDNVGKVMSSTGTDANVYTNSTAGFQNCNSNQVQGSVLAQGSVQISGPCKVTGDLWAKGAISVTGENAVISGYLRSLQQIDINVNSLTVGKRAEAPVVKRFGATCTLSYCAQTLPAAPPAKPFPIIRGDSAARAAWVAGGYALKVIDNSSQATLGVSCATGDTGSLNGVTNWIKNNAPTWTGKTLVVNTCTYQEVRMQGTDQVKLAGDLAIMSYGGFASQNSGVLSYVPTVSGQKHALHLIVPYDAAASLPCTTPRLMLQQYALDSALHTLVYSPCDVTVSNSVTMTGQIYSGSNLNLNNGLNLQFAEVPLPAGSVIVTGGVVSGFTLDVIYKRETRA